MIDENTSDGYHTFKELYEHRMALTSTLTILRLESLLKNGADIVAML